MLDWPVIDTPQHRSVNVVPLLPVSLFSSSEDREDGVHVGQILRRLPQNACGKDLEDSETA